MGPHSRKAHALGLYPMWNKQAILMNYKLMGCFFHGHYHSTFAASALIISYVEMLLFIFYLFFILNFFKIRISLKKKFCEGK